MQISPNCILLKLSFIQLILDRFQIRPHELQNQTWSNLQDLLLAISIRDYNIIRNQFRLQFNNKQKIAKSAGNPS